MGKVYDLGLVVGRFQHIQNGHESLITAATTLCDRVIVFVGSAQEWGTARNPLNVETRIKLIRSIFDDEKQVLIYALPDMTDETDICFEWGRYLLDKVDHVAYKNPELFIFGNDEVRGSTWFSPEDLSNTSQLILNRQEIPISATMIRDLIAMDQRKIWMKWVNPRIHKYYDEIRAEIMSIDYYQDRAAKLTNGELKEYVDELIAKLK